MIDEIKNKATKWLFSIALKKAIVRVATYILAFLSSHKIQIIYNNAPVDVNTLTGILIGLFEMLRNMLKTKYPDKFGWM